MPKYNLSRTGRLSWSVNRSWTSRGWPARWQSWKWPSRSWSRRWTPKRNASVCTWRPRSEPSTTCFVPPKKMENDSHMHKVAYSVFTHPAIYLILRAILQVSVIALTTMNSLMSPFSPGRYCIQSDNLVYSQWYRIVGDRAAVSKRRKVIF